METNAVSVKNENAETVKARSSRPRIARVPVGKRTKSLCVKAVNEDPLAIKYVPEKMLSVSMVERASKEDPEIIKLIPDKYKTDRVCENAVQYDGMLLSCIPADRRTKALMCTAVANDPAALHLIPRARRTESVYCSLVEAHPDLLGNVPVKYRTEAVCLNAVRIMDRVANLVPRKAKTLRLCTRVMIRYPDLDFTPACIYRRAYLEMLKVFASELETVIDNHTRIRHMCGYNDNLKNRAYLERQLSAYVRMTYKGVKISIDQSPEFTRNYTHYHLYAYFDGERKDLRAVKKVLAEIMAEIERLEAE